jgi:hypothetical protein
MKAAAIWLLLLFLVVLGPAMRLAYAAPPEIGYISEDTSGDLCLITGEGFVPGQTQMLTWSPQAPTGQSADEIGKAWLKDLGEPLSLPPTPAAEGGMGRRGTECS